MKTWFNKIFRFGVAVYTAALLFIVIPLHYHGDHVEHNDCIVCLLAHESATIAVVFMFAMVAGIFFIRIVSPILFPLLRCKETFRPRAPPVT